MQTASGASLDAKRVLALLGLLGAGLFLWDQPVLWPLKLLVVMIHETGHAVATLLVGGSVTRVTLAANESGQCLSMIPEGFLPKVIVYSAGYVGSALVGSILLALTLRFRARRWVLGAACVWLGAMAVFYAGDAFTLAFCLGTAVVLAVVARYLPGGAVEWVNLVIGAFSCLYVLMDLKDDLWNGQVRAISDAELLSQVTVVPAIVWAAAWTVASLLLLGLSAWWSVRAAPKRGRLDVPLRFVARPRLPR